MHIVANKEGVRAMRIKMPSDNEGLNDFFDRGLIWVEEGIDYDK